MHRSSQFAQRGIRHIDVVQTDRASTRCSIGEVKKFCIMYTFFVVLLSKMFNFEDALYRPGADAQENTGHLFNSIRYKAVRHVSASFAGAYYLKKWKELQGIAEGDSPSGAFRHFCT